MCNSTPESIQGSLVSLTHRKKRAKITQPVRHDKALPRARELYTGYKRYWKFTKISLKFQ